MIGTVYECTGSSLLVGVEAGRLKPSLILLVGIVVTRRLRDLL